MSGPPRQIPVRNDGPSEVGAAGSPALPTASPPIDIHETADALVLEADVPGVAESGLQVEVADQVLVIRGRAEPALPAGARPLHLEFPPRELVRSFILSAEFDRERIAAELGEGVLRVRLPRAERPPVRRIEVKPSGG